MSDRAAANTEAHRRLCASEPRLVDVRPAGEVVPGYAPNLILTSGAPLPFAEYTGGQREAIIGAAQFEGLAATREEAIAELESGEIEVDGATATAASARWPGVYTASMPVFVVENPPFGNTGVLQLLRGQGARAGSTTAATTRACTSASLHINTVLGPVVGAAVRRRGGIELGADHAPRRADGRRVPLAATAAATMLFEEALRCRCSTSRSTTRTACARCTRPFQGNDYHFLRLSMAACKAALRRGARRRGVDAS